MVKKFEKIIASTFYNELFSSLNHFILSNRSKIKISKCCIDDINYITLDDFEIRRVLSTKKVGCQLKSFLQVIAYVDVKGKNRNTYEVDSGEIWLHVSATYELNDGIKNFIIREINTTDEMQIPESDFTANFVPIIESKRIAEISNDILFEYQPDVLLTPKPLDIRSLIEAVGVNLIEARLSHDQSIFGEIVFKETTIEVFNENGEYSPEDILAFVKYSVKPKDIEHTVWIAGNGEIEGEWIINKTACECLRNGKLVKSSGFSTGF